MNIVHKSKCTALERV